jgi:hypothetical protein
VLNTILPNEGRSKEDRRELINKAVAALKQNTSLPDESRDSIYEQFDPVLIMNEIIESMIYSAFDQLLDYNGDDAGFIELIKKLSADVIVRVTSEIEEGFVDGINDVLVFFKANISSILMAAAPPQQAAMAKGMIVPTLLRFIEKCWNEGKKTSAESSKPVAAQPVAKPSPTPVVEQQPPEEKKEE